MNKKLFYYTLAGIFFSMVCGTLLHFAYKFSHNNPIVAMFVPVSESTWEHMKLVFFPTFLYTLAGWPFFYKSYQSFFPSFLAGTFTGTLSVAIIFYTYTGIIGKHYLFLDIVTFLVSVLIAYCLSYQLAVQNCRPLPNPVLVTLTVTLMVCFFLFTYHPPDIGLFALPLQK